MGAAYKLRRALATDRANSRDGVANGPLAAAVPVGIWRELVDKLAFVAYVPRPVAAELIEEQVFSRRSGETYHVLEQRQRRTYVSLPADAYALWRMMDGTRPARLIALEYFFLRKQLVTGLLRSLIEQLREKGLLEDPPARIFSSLAERTRKPGPAASLRAVAQSIIARNLVVVRSGDAVFRVLYQRLGWLFFTPPAQVTLVAIILFGLIAWSTQLAQDTHALLTTGGSYLLGLITLVLLNVLMISLHELGHAMAVKHAGREVNAVGLLLYYGVPCAYVDTTDIWMADRKARIWLPGRGHSSP